MCVLLCLEGSCRMGYLLHLWTISFPGKTDDVPQGPGAFSFDQIIT